MKKEYIPIDWSKIQEGHINSEIPRYLNFSIKVGWELSDKPINENNGDVVG